MNQHAVEGFAVIGILVTTFATAGVLMFLACGIYNDLISRPKRAARKETLAEVANSLSNAAPWFCEDKITNDLINQLAQHIEVYGHVDADRLREEWRKARADKAQS